MSLWRKWKNLSGKWFKIGWRTFSRAGRRQTTSKWPFSSSPPSKGETPAWSVELMFMNENVEKRVVGEGLKSLTERVQIHPSCSIGAVSNGWHKKGNLNSAQTGHFSGPRWVQKEMIFSGEEWGARSADDPGRRGSGGCWWTSPGNNSLPLWKSLETNCYPPNHRSL